MTKEEYLLARGWRCVESDRGDRWIDPIPHPRGYAVARHFPTDTAEQIQLDRDAACRDYVNARRPV